MNGLNVEPAERGVHAPLICPSMGEKKIRGADEREDFAGAVVDHHGGGVADALPAQTREVSAHGGFGNTLQLQIKRGANARANRV